MNKKPAEQRERLHNQEQKHTPNPQRSALSTMSWKETLVLIVIVIIGYIIYQLFT